MNQRLASIIISVLSVVVAILITFAPVSEAKADSWFSITGNVTYNHLYDYPMSGEYRDEIIWSGGHVSIHPEYHFTNWFALGLDVSAGGVQSIGESDSFDTFKRSNDLAAFLSEDLLTFRFGIPLEMLDIWFELGVGVYMLAGDYIDEEGEYSKFCMFWDVRGRLGLTYKLNESVGIGFHVGASYLIVSRFAINAGLHFQYNF